MRCLVPLKCNLATSQLYKRPCPSVGWSVRCKAIGRAFVRIGENGEILNEMKERARRKERGVKSDEEEGAMRRKEH